MAHGVHIVKNVVPSSFDPGVGLDLVKSDMGLCSRWPGATFFDNFYAVGHWGTHTHKITNNYKTYSKLVASTNDCLTNEGPPRYHNRIRPSDFTLGFKITSLMEFLLVDCNGRMCSLILCTCSSNKWKKFSYNKLNPLEKCLSTPRHDIQLKNHWVVYIHKNSVMLNFVDNFSFI